VKGADSGSFVLNGGDDDVGPSTNAGSATSPFANIWN